MFNYKRKLKKLGCACLLLLGCLIPAISGQAAEAGSITISYHGRTDEETIVLSDTPFAWYQIGFWEEDGWKLSEEFEQSGVSLESSDSSERKKQAEKLYAYAVRKNLQRREQKTNEAGITTFENLEKGLYLVAQTKEAQKGTWIFRSAPFLVSIPTGEKDELLWDVVIEPKSEWDDMGTGGGSGGDSGDDSSGDSGNDSGGGSGGGNHSGGSDGGKPVVPDGEIVVPGEGNVVPGEGNVVPGEGIVIPDGDVILSGKEPVETGQTKENETNKKAPKTGDSSSLDMWIMVLIISGIVVSLFVWLLMKIRISENRETAHLEADKKRKKK